MIKKNYKLGKHTIPVLAKFGTGDIEIINHSSHPDEDKPYVLVSLSQGEKHEIGVHVDFEDSTSDDLEEIPMAMMFTKVESIDSLISQLQRAKDKLNELNG